MIRIRKPPAPAVLTSHGTEAKAELVIAYSGAAAAYRRGRLHFNFDRAIYAHDEVKVALIEAQYGKCAFCESKIAHTCYGDVEHFRPKAAVRQLESDPLQYPGNYWLAYEWGNLFVSCELCNQRFKRNCFPLRNPRSRTRSHRGNLKRESPLLLDPANSPENHLTFVNEMVVPNGGSEIGRTTIAVLGLNRAELLEQRRERLKFLRVLQEILGQLIAADNATSNTSNNIQVIRRILEESIRDDAEYAAMARVVLG